MTSPNSEQLVRQRDLIPVCGLFLSVVLLGVTSFTYGYTPFSPTFCVNHSGLAMSIHMLFLTSLWNYEMRFSQYSVRPEIEEDDHTPFWLYMGTLTLWLGLLLPRFWLELGDFLERGASLDQSLYQTMNLWMSCLCLGLVVSRLRVWAHERKDISRVNRVSPPRHTELGVKVIHRKDLDPSEMWSPVSPSLISPPTSQSLKDSYQQRRLDKLAHDTKSLSVLREQNKPESSRRKAQERISEIRRSTGDYDTRFNAYPPEFDTHMPSPVQIELDRLTLYHVENDVMTAPSTEEPQAQVELSHEEDFDSVNGTDTLVMPPQLDLINELTQNLSNEDIPIWEEVNEIL